jgi:uroporphyrinogen-III synthase
MARQSRLPPILLTRPADRADRFAADLLRLPFQPLEIIQSPLLAVEYLPVDLPVGPWSALVFTSETAVAAFQELRPALHLTTRAWCVGERTAAVARAAGFDARSAQGDAADLCRLILENGESGPLLHLHGQDTRGDIAAKLTSAGIQTNARVIYRQLAQPLSATARTLLSRRSPVIAPVFSPRTARILSEERIRLDLPAPLWIAAFSQAVADAMSLRIGDQIAISDKPASAALIQIIETFLQAGA